MEYWIDGVLEKALLHNSSTPTSTVKLGGSHVKKDYSAKVFERSEAKILSRHSHRGRQSTFYRGADRLGKGWQRRRQGGYQSSDSASIRKNKRGPRSSPLLDLYHDIADDLHHVP